jgi:hypothetical protein
LRCNEHWPSTSPSIPGHLSGDRVHNLRYYQSPPRQHSPLKGSNELVFIHETNLPKGTKLH